MIFTYKDFSFARVGIVMRFKNERIIVEEFRIDIIFDSRFGSYGFIRSVACYCGGQSTNLRINKLVLKYFEAGNPLRLYFMETVDHKQVERVLLQAFVTPFNVRNN